MALIAKWSSHQLWCHVTDVSAWVRPSLVLVLYWAHGEWNYTSRFSPTIIWPKFNWEFDMQPVYFQAFCHLIKVISPTIRLDSHVKIQLFGSYSDFFSSMFVLVSMYYGSSHSIKECQFGMQQNFNWEIKIVYSEIQTKHLAQKHTFTQAHITVTPQYPLYIMDIDTLC